MDNSIQVIRQAHEQDLKSLQLFLIENKLRPSIVINENSLFYYTLIDEKIIGTIGAEFNQHYALIRAAGIAQEWRKLGIAQRLFHKLTADLEKKGIKHFYLFSRQASEFWTKMGFTKCPIEDVINVLSDTPQVKEFIADNTIWTDIAWYKSVKSI